MKAVELWVYSFSCYIYMYVTYRYSSTFLRFLLNERGENLRKSCQRYKAIAIIGTRECCSGRYHATNEPRTTIHKLYICMSRVKVQGSNANASKGWTRKNILNQVLVENNASEIFSIVISLKAVFLLPTSVTLN